MSRLLLDDSSALLLDDTSYLLLDDEGGGGGGGVSGAVVSRVRGMSPGVSVLRPVDVAGVGTSVQ
jgi:hypothetical protein